MQSKKMLGYICHIVLLLIIVSTLFLILTIKINADETKAVEPYFKPLAYKGISAVALQEKLGQPDQVKEWKYEISHNEDGKINYCNMISYFYDTREFMFVSEDGLPGTLVRIHVVDKIPYKDDTLLALFGVNDNYTNSELEENTAGTYRVFNVGKDQEGIYDFWVTDRDANYLYDVNITFFNGLFQDDMLHDGVEES